MAEAQREFCCHFLFEAFDVCRKVKAILLELIGRGIGKLACTQVDVERIVAVESKAEGASGAGYAEEFRKPDLSIFDGEMGEDGDGVDKVEGGVAKGQWWIKLVGTSFDVRVEALKMGDGVGANVAGVSLHVGVEAGEMKKLAACAASEVEDAGGLLHGHTEGDGGGDDGQESGEAGLVVMAYGVAGGAAKNMVGWDLEVNDAEAAEQCAFGGEIKINAAFGNALCDCLGVLRCTKCGG